METTMNHPAAFVDSTDGETASVEDVHAGASSDVHFTIKMTLNSKPSCGIDNLGNTRTGRHANMETAITNPIC